MCGMDAATVLDRDALLLNLYVQCERTDEDIIAERTLRGRRMHYRRWAGDVG
jgi:hypothetical protein